MARRIKLSPVVPEGCEEFLRIPTTARITGMSASSIARKEKMGLFPKRRALSPGGKIVGHLRSEVEAFLKALAFPEMDDRQAEILANARSKKAA